MRLGIGLTVVLAACAWSGPVQAQILHGQPQLSAYTSPTQRPTVSAQTHWRVQAGRLVPDQTCALAPTDLLTCAHVHSDLTCYLYVELNAGDTTRCEFAITLHHFPGYVSAVYSGFDKFGDTGVRVWDATGTQTPPSMVGDPVGDRVFTGHFTVALPPNVEGWWFLTNTVCVQFTNNDAVCMQPLVPIWSTQHPTSDVVSHPIPSVIARSNDMVSATRPEVTWGQLTVQYDCWIPILPIAQPFQTCLAFYSYGRTVILPGVDQIRYDMDLHHELSGRLVFDKATADDVGMPWAFDPAVLGNGPHKVAALRVQPDGPEQLTTVLVITVTATTSTEPPLTCQDPLAVNVGGPLPCIYPQPSPIWTPGTVFSTPTPSGVQFELCPGTDPNAPTCQLK